MANNNYQRDSSYKIGSSLSYMISLKNLGIAPPDQVTYQPSSVVYVRGDMSRVGDGFAVVSWIWDTISIEKLSQLLKFVGSSTYANVFIQTDVRDGTHAVAENAFKVFSAMMWKPLLYGQEGVPIAKSPYVMQTVNIQFVNLVEQVGYLSI